MAKDISDGEKSKWMLHKLNPFFPSCIDCVNFIMLESNGWCLLTQTLYFSVYELCLNLSFVVLFVVVILSEFIEAELKKRNDSPVFHEWVSKKKK